MREFIIACKNGYQYEPVGELVRCKDCKHFQEDECPWTGIINVNDFCSKGERKEVENG